MTYYIDYSAGSDASDGLTKQTAWKRCPGMAGFSGAYVHSAGDRFIFKGGITWPRTCFQLRIIAGGTLGNVDYYGVDQTWFSGGVWSKPKWDLEDLSLGSGTSNYAVYITAADPYVTFEHIEILRHRGEAVHGSSSVNVAFTGSGTVTFSNCLVRDWSIQGPLPPNVGAGNLGGGIWWTAGSGTVLVSHCEFHQQNVASTNGQAVRGVNLLEYSEIHHCGTGWTGGGIVRYNHFHDLSLPTVDPTAHLAAIKTFAVSEVYGNLIHDLDGSCAPIELSSGYESGSGLDLVYNNVIFATETQPPIWLKTDTANYANLGVRILNNTVVRSGGICVYIYDGGGGVELASADIRNNHFITEGSALDVSNVTNPTISDNLIQTNAEATSDGYTISNLFQPVSAGSPTVGWGVNLSAAFTKDRLEVTRIDPWDLGAYEFESGGGTSAVSSARSASWNVRNEVETDREIIWDVQADYSSSRSTTWNVLAEVSRSAQSLWNIDGPTTVSRQALWDVHIDLPVVRVDLTNTPDTSELLIPDGDAEFLLV